MIRFTKINDVKISSFGNMTTSLCFVASAGGTWLFLQCGENGEIDIELMSFEYVI